MTQPNPGDGGNAAPTNPTPTNPAPQNPATGPAAQPTFVQPTLPPGQPAAEPATGAADPVAGGQDGSAGDADQLGEGGKKALAAERARAKAAEKAAAEQTEAHNRQLADLKKQLDALQPAAELFAQFRKVAVPDAEKTDVERLQEELAQVRQETQTERQARWRLEIATDKGLTKDQAAELRGDTQQELAAHADRLLKLFPKAPPPPPPDPTAEPANAQQPAPNGQPAPAAGPKPDPSQGARGPVDIHAQIQDALAKGDTRTSIALKQQLAAQQRGGTQ